MKANETLDKLYFNQHTAKYNHERRNDDDIEYIRTDAFIEKAASYIQQHWIWNTKMIEDFKNYMEGE